MAVGIEFACHTPYPKPQFVLCRGWHSCRESATFSAGFRRFPSPPQ